MSAAALLAAAHYGGEVAQWEERLARSLAAPDALFTYARNAASLALHARLGFVEVGRAASFLGEQFAGGAGVLMRWSLAGAP